VVDGPLLPPDPSRLEPPHDLVDPARRHAESAGQLPRSDPGVAFDQLEGLELTWSEGTGVEEVVSVAAHDV
jgi:hypothetical protein